jgi:two-component system, sensor histidine kinase PdtaS
MSIEQMQCGADLPPSIIFDIPAFRSIESYESELTKQRLAELELREALARDDARIRQQDEVIRQQDLLSKESDHRLLNGLQMIVSLLSLQSRASANAEAAAQLAIAANRVATIERVHRRLHCFDGTPAVAFKHYLEDFCRDFSAMLSSDEGADRSLVVEGVEVNLPTNTGISLAFIVNELVTNAAKYGKGRITVSLEANSGRGFTISVSNDGPGLPEGFDPAATKGLGLRLIRSLVARIGGELLIGRGDRDLGTRFTVLFP